MIVGGQTEARALLSSTIIDYHEPFDQGFRHMERSGLMAVVPFTNSIALVKFE